MYYVFCFIHGDPLKWIWKSLMPSRSKYYRKNYGHSRDARWNSSCEIETELKWTEQMKPVLIRNCLFFITLYLPKFALSAQPAIFSLHCTLGYIIWNTKASVNLCVQFGTSLFVSSSRCTRITPDWINRNFYSVTTFHCSIRPSNTAEHSQLAPQAILETTWLIQQMNIFYAIPSGFCRFARLVLYKSACFC